MSDRKVAPNGAVMRTSITGIYMFNDIQAVIENTLSFCTVTHADPRLVKGNKLKLPNPRSVNS